MAPALPHCWATSCLWQPTDECPCSVFVSPLCYPQDNSPCKGFSSCWRAHCSMRIVRNVSNQHTRHTQLLLSALDALPQKRPAGKWEACHSMPLPREFWRQLSLPVFAPASASGLARLSGKLSAQGCFWHYFCSPSCTQVRLQEHIH